MFYMPTCLSLAEVFVHFIVFKSSIDINYILIWGWSHPHPYIVLSFYCLGKNTEECNVILIFYTYDLWILFWFLITRTHLHKNGKCVTSPVYHSRYMPKKVSIWLIKGTILSHYWCVWRSVFYPHNEMHPGQKWEFGPLIHSFSCMTCQLYELPILVLHTDLHA